MSVKFEFDPGKLQARFATEAKATEQAVVEQIISDCNGMFTPVEAGDLRDSARPQEHDGHMAAVWDTVYAAYQYYGCWPDGSHQINEANRNREINPAASSLWVEKARAQYGDDWEKVAQNAVSKMQK